MMNISVYWQILKCFHNYQRYNIDELYTLRCRSMSGLNDSARKCSSSKEFPLIQIDHNYDHVMI
ncbi:MAG: hypothetical protein ABIP35_02625, partial [Ginsengibacter sp.]